MAPTCFQVHVKDKCFVIEDIDLDIYFTKDLYSDVMSKAKEQNIELPCFVGLKYHPPFKELQREHLVNDSDWIKMVEEWQSVSSSYIPIHVVELLEPSALQIMSMTVDSSFQNDKESNISTDEQWADNLLATPSTPSKGRRNLESELGPFKKSKLAVRKQPRRPHEELSHSCFTNVEDLPILTEYNFTTSNMPLISTAINYSPTMSPSRPPHTNEQLRVDIGNVRIPKKRNKNSIECGRKQFEITELNVKLFAKELKGLEAYDIPSLCKPQITPLDLFFEEVVPPNESDGAQEECVDKEDCSEDDEQGSEFHGDEEECSSSVDVSLDEESQTDEEFDVNADTDNKMKLGHVEEDEDVSGSQLIVNKMAKVFNTGRLWVKSTNEKVELREGDIFCCKKDLLRVMRDYIIQKGISLRKIKNDKRKYTQRCVNDKCKFRIHASILVDGHSWMIKTFTDGHVCSVKEHHKRAGASWVATHLLEDFRSNREMKASTVKNLILKRFNTYIPKYTCWRALKLMRNIVEGRHEDGYKLLPQYMEVFKGRNPDSECFIRWEEIGPGRNPIFRRCLICIGSTIKSFKEYCRPLIGIDACHLKGPYQGILLTAIGLDGNNGQFPLAYGVADSEDEIEWGFFLHGLAEGLGCTQDSSRYTIISDRHQAIIKGLNTVMPKASRRICVLHFYKNFASKFPGAWFHSFFYIVANTFSEYVFNKAMEKIKEEDSEAYEWLDKNEPKEHWARHKFAPALKCDDNTNNFVESFNKAIVVHRAKPTLQMLEEIRKLVGSRFEKRFSMGRSWSTEVTPYVDKKLRDLAMDSRVCSEVVAAGRGEFDVLDGNTNFTVRLGDHSCDCNRWQVTGLPCKHAVRCILRINEKLEDCCAPWFSVENYKGLYDAIIHPIPDPCMWGPNTLPELDPPMTNKKKKGRPKKHKRREGIDDLIAKKRGQAHGTKRCSKCKQLGHNHRTCGQSRDPDGRLMKKYIRKKKKSSNVEILS